MLGLFLGAALLLPPVYAQQSAALDTRGWSAGQYNDHIVHVEYKAALEMMQATQVLLDNPAPGAFEQWRAGCLANVEVAIARLRALPPYQGDATLRDASLAMLLTFEQHLQREFIELNTLMFQPSVREADVQRAAQLSRELDAAYEVLDKQIQRVQQDFARRHNFLLVDQEHPELALDTGPEFSFPGMPYTDPALTAEQVASFTMRYHNELTERADRMLGATNTFVERAGEPDGACEAARLEALAAVEAELALVRDVGPWLGDERLWTATVGLGELFQGQLTQNYAQFCAAMGDKRLKPAQLAAANRVAQESAALAQQTLDGWHQTAAAFRERWGLVAWEAWQRAHGQL